MFLLKHYSIMFTYTAPIHRLRPLKCLGHPSQDYYKLNKYSELAFFLRRTQVGLSFQDF
ncbi:hypothetical protein CCP3SC1AL1_1360004 [Gammaproteobacteria bacterium]